MFLFVLFALQLVSFGLSNEMMATFKEDNLMTFRHLFLEGFKDHRQGNFALYTKIEVYDHIYYIIDKVLQIKHTEIFFFFLFFWPPKEYFLLLFQYIHLHNLTLGNLAYEKVDGKYTPLSICQMLYGNVSLDPGRDTFDIDPHVEKGIKSELLNLCLKLKISIKLEGIADF